MARNKLSVKARKKRAMQYLSRGQALRKLQLTLRDFRRLCIIKGIYPVEPKSKKVNPTSQARTYYLRKDIQFLSHEPVVWKFWDMKSFVKRLARAKGRKDKESMERIRENRPFYKLDHIVKERYPTFMDSIRDLDDALCMCFLYANFGKSKVLPLELIELSRKLTLEFLYYVMETKALRRVFISIKGIYYEANILGHNVRWVVPHKFVMKREPDVDFEIMKTFTEFYVTLMGFVNYRLFTSAGFFYPPVLNIKQHQAADSTAAKVDAKHSESDNEEDEEEEDTSDDFIAALNTPLLGNHGNANTFQGEQEGVDSFDTEDEGPAEFGSSVLTFQQLQNLQNLFKGQRFFLNREVPRESLCFVIRSFGGEVSWDKVCFPGATFDENDSKITHQIVDRDVLPNKHIGRFYVQPQWVFDCVNARKLLPVQDYFMGVKLPAHLSPFVEEKEGEYVPPEKLAMMGLDQEKVGEEAEEEEVDDDEDENETEEVEDKNNNKKKNGKKINDIKKVTDKKNKKDIDVKTNAGKDAEEVPETVVKRGQISRKNAAREAEFAAAEEKRLKVMSMPKKRKELYNRIVKSNKKQTRETETLMAKRKSIDKEVRRSKRIRQ